MEIDVKEILKIIFILEYVPTQIYEKEFIEEFRKIKDKDNEKIKMALLNWIGIHEELSQDDNTAEGSGNVIKITPEHLSSSESEKTNNSNPNSNNNSTHNSLNSTRSNTPDVMATRNEVRADIRTALNTIFGIDVGVDLDTAPVNTVTAAIQGLLPPIN